MAETQIYTVDTPDGKVIELEGPVGASEETVLNNARELYNAQLQSQQTAEQPVSTEPDYANMSGLEVAGRAIQNAPKDVADLAVGTVKAVADPVGTTTGVIDLASAGMSKVLDFTGLSKYADPEKMERYRTLRGHIADQLSDTFTKEGLKKRIAEKPITSLLDVSLAGQAVTAPAKATRYGGMANQLMKNIDPIQGGAKVTGMGYNKLKDIATSQTNVNRVVDAKTRRGVKEGYTITPSESKGAGLLTKAVEKITPKGTANKARELNQENTNRLIRKHLEVPQDMPLSSILDTVKKRSSPAYEKVGKLDSVITKRGRTQKQYDKDALGTKYETAPKKIPAQRTRTGAEILKDWKLANKQAKAEFNKQKNSKIPDFTKANLLKDKVGKLTDELEQLAKLNKKPSLVKNLKEARKDYAKAYSIQSSIDNAGNLNATKFANANRNNQALDGFGKVVKEFAETHPSLVGKQQSTLMDFLKTSGAFAAGPLTLGSGAAAGFAGMLTGPSLLSSRRIQRNIAKPDYANPLYLQQLLKTLSKTPTSAVAVPSLLDRTDVEYIQDLQL